MYSVAVIGCGAAGLNSAIKIQEKLKNINIVIFAEHVSPYTTSDIAAGLIEPLTSNNLYPNKNVGKWSSNTLKYLSKLWLEGSAKDLGLSLVPVIELSEEKDYKFPDWASQTLGYTKLTNDHLKRLSVEHNKTYTGGISYVTFTWESSTFLPYLQEQFLRNGGKIINRTIHNLGELCDFDLIVNCTGLGAKTLVQDESLEGYRGQVARVNAPWQLHTLLVDSNYIITNTNSVILGKVKEKDTVAKITDKDKIHILEGCMNLIPGLKGVQVLNHKAGLRPTRPSIRLEYEQVPHQEKILKVIHNYGHGSYGITLSVGCAQEVAEIAQSVLNSFKHKL